MRSINAKHLIMNLVYQHHFFKVFNQNLYTNKVFFRYNEVNENASHSPIILEIGFLLYFIIIKLRDWCEGNMTPHRDYEWIFNLIPEKKLIYITLNKNLLSEIYDIFNDVYYICKLFISRKSKSKFMIFLMMCTISANCSSVENRSLFLISRFEILSLVKVD